MFTVPIYWVVTALLIFSAVLLVGWLKAARNRDRIQKERDEIVGEEKRMFDFLHHIGLAIEKDITPGQLYLEIVEGFREVLDSDGGAIYLLSEDRKYLVPKYLSSNCPPLMPVSNGIVSRALSDPRALASFLMLTKTKVGQGLLGEVLLSGSCLHIDSLGEHSSLQHSAYSYKEGVAVMLSPMQYGGRDLGLVAIVRKHQSGRFSDNDFDVFKSVAEQSAFAMGNAMVHRELAEKRKMDDELRTAREVQNVLLPSGEPRIPGYRVYGSNTPARMISGDYFDYIALPDNKWGIVIADVTGKGVPAGLLMAMCRSVLRLTAMATNSPSEALGWVNRHLFPDVREDMFVSMVYIILDSKNGMVRMARAGHDPPLMFRAKESEIEVIKPPGLALGIDQGDVFDRVTKDMELEMAEGDCLLLHTDGVREAVNEKDEEFGSEKLEIQFHDSAKMGAEAVVVSIRQAVSSFAGNEPQMDDITLIAIEKK